MVWAAVAIKDAGALRVTLDLQGFLVLTFVFDIALNIFAAVILFCHQVCNSAAHVGGIYIVIRGLAQARGQEAIFIADKRWIYMVPVIVIKIERSQRASHRWSTSSQR
jgi:hypothetical protein